MKKIISEYYITFCIYALIGWLYEVLWLRFVVPPHEWINRGILLGPFLPIYGFGMLILLILLKKVMRHKHPTSNPLYLSVSIFTIITFITVTIIEYTKPKIYHVDIFLQQYGLLLLIVNIVGIVLFNVLVKIIKKDFLKNIDTTPVIVFLLIWIITTLIEYISHYAIDKTTGKLLWNYSKDFLNINSRVNWDASRNFAIGGTFLLYLVQPLINKLFNIINEKAKLITTLVIGIPMLLDFILHVLLKVI